MTCFGRFLNSIRKRLHRKFAHRSIERKSTKILISATWKCSVHSTNNNWRSIFIETSPAILSTLFSQNLLLHVLCPRPKIQFYYFISFNHIIAFDCITFLRSFASSFCRQIYNYFSFCVFRRVRFVYCIFGSKSIVKHFRSSSFDANESILILIIVVCACLLFCCAISADKKNTISNNNRLIKNILQSTQNLFMLWKLVQREYRNWWRLPAIRAIC